MTFRVATNGAAFDFSDDSMRHQDHSLERVQRVCDVPSRSSSTALQSQATPPLPYGKKDINKLIEPVNQNDLWERLAGVGRRASQDIAAIVRLEDVYGRC